MFDEEPGGSRPPCLGEPRGPQERIQQRTMEQLADVVPMVQVLDFLVAQEGGGAGVGPAGGFPQAPRQADPSGYRSAQEVKVIPSLFRT